MRAKLILACRGSYHFDRIREKGDPGCTSTNWSDPERSMIARVVQRDWDLFANMSLTAGEVHVWQIHLVAPEKRMQFYRESLSADEIQRAGRFRFEKDRTRFIVCRAAIREILASYLKAPPQQLNFCYSAKGKPDLSPELARTGIKFNVSHSRDFGLLAVTNGHRLGVDIEYIDSELATRENTTQFFSAAEVSTLRRLPRAEATEAFFSCWTRKEAFIKALGEGLSVPLNSFDVAFGPGVRAALLRVDNFSHEQLRWSMYDIIAPRGYAAALVVEGKEHRVLPLAEVRYA